MKYQISGCHFGKAKQLEYKIIMSSFELSTKNQPDWAADTCKSFSLQLFFVIAKLCSNCVVLPILSFVESSVPHSKAVV